MVLCAGAQGEAEVMSVAQSDLVPFVLCFLCSLWPFREVRAYASTPPHFVQALMNAPTGFG